MCVLVLLLFFLTSTFGQYTNVQSSESAARAICSQFWTPESCESPENKNQQIAELLYDCVYSAEEKVCTIQINGHIEKPYNFYKDGLLHFFILILLSVILSLSIMKLTSYIYFRIKGKQSTLKGNLSLIYLLASFILLILYICYVLLIDFKVH